METKLVDIGPFKLPVSRGHDGAYFVSTLAVANACGVELEGDEPAMVTIADVVGMITGWALAQKGKACTVLVYCALDAQPEKFPGDCAIRLLQFEDGTLGTVFGIDQRNRIGAKLNAVFLGNAEAQYNRDNMTIEQQLETETFEYTLRRRYRPGTDLEQVVDMCLSFLNAA